jgi:serine/threonine protein kinase
VETPEQLPEQFGRYRIIKRLGQGGMGSVYLAEDTQLSRRVALKVPEFAPDSAPDTRQRFLEEARSAAMLDHPNLCRVYDAGEINGRLYLTMAYIEGQSLEESISDQARTQQQAAALVGKLAQALRAAHAQGVIHRDLKPANIMIRTRGKRREPVIVDFGLARRDQPGKERLTRTGQVMGTPAYMAPEQLRGDPKEIGPACDIYALGVILYELLTGRLPFCDSGLALVGQILTQAPLPPSVHLSDLDPALEAICLKAMAKNVRDRYASMGDLAAALNKLLQSPSATTPPPSSPAPPSDSEEATLRLVSDSQVGRLPDPTMAESVLPAIERSPEPVPEATLAPAGRRLPWPLFVASSVVGVVVLGVLVGVTISRSPLRRGDNHRLPTRTERLPALDVAGGTPSSNAGSPARGPAESSNRTPVEEPPVPRHAAPPVSPAAFPLKPAEKTPLPPTRLVHVNEFNDPRSGLLKDLSVPHDPDHGQSDGVYYVYSAGGWHGWNIDGIPADGTCEVVARLVSDDPSNGGSWSVQVARAFGSEERGFVIKITLKGELFLEPNPFKKAAAYRLIDPRMGPILHPAIKPANLSNKLLLLLRKREVVIFVNGVQVCDPVRFDYEVTPSVLGFGAGGPKKRAEFDRLEIREIIERGDALGQGRVPVP